MKTERPIRRSKRMISYGIINPSHKISKNRSQYETKIHDLPTEIISHIHSFLIPFNLTTCKSSTCPTFQDNLVYTAPDHALCCKEWSSVFKNNKSKLNKEISYNLEHCKAMKVMMLTHVGFGGTIHKLLTYKMFHVLDLFIESRHFDKTHYIWKDARNMCERERIVDSLAYLEKHGLGYDSP